MLVVASVLLSEGVITVVSNDNDSDSVPPRSRSDAASQTEEMSLSGGTVAVALGMISLDAAHSLSLALQNAVVEQQNSWLMQRCVMAKAVDQLLRNSAGDRAVDLMMRLFDPAAKTDK
jgi:Killing trait